MASTAKIDLAWLILILTFHIHAAAQTPKSTTVGSTNHLSKYNETCKTDIDCNRSLQLKCINGVCNCTDSDSMLFRNETRMCHIKGGHKCSTTVSSLTHSPITPPDCVPNSRCQQDGYCQCRNGTYQTDDGACHPKRGYSRMCHSTLHCQDDRGFSCMEFMAGFSVCNCNQADSLVYNHMGKACVVSAGRQITPHISKYKCVTNARYNNSTRKCQCNSGFTEKYGFCIVPFGGICNIDQPCEPDMYCREGRCVCRFSGKDRVNGSCYSHAGQLCVLGAHQVSMKYGKDPNFQNISIPCIPDAVCSLNEETDNQECLCRSGLVGVDGKCQKDNGRGLVGAVCVNATGKGSTSCTAGAVCSVPNGNQEGRCKCKFGYKANIDGTCNKN